MLVFSRVRLFFQNLSLSKWAWAVFVLVSTWFFFNIHAYSNEGKDNCIANDMFAYYIYLPAKFIYDDVKYDFLDTLPDSVGPKASWANLAPNGVWVNKMTLGMAISYSPFFGIAHAQTLFLGDHPANGFSLHYRFWVSFGALLYAFLAIWLLSRLLLRWFPEAVVALVMTGIGLGSNYFFYAANEGMMSHSFLFLLFTIGMWLTVQLYEYNSWRNFILLGGTLGWITLIRPTNALFVLIPLLYGIARWEDVPPRLSWIKTNWLKITVAAVVAVIVIFPQLLLWKSVTGTWLFYSYANEHLHLDAPNLLNGLFSYRKGWYLYTPIMFFATIGFIWTRKYAREWGLAIPIFVIINVYVILSWWCWWYGGSFGLRAMIDSYPLMAFGLAAFISQALAGPKIAKIALTVIFSILLPLNWIQTYQYRKMYIHFDSMTKEVYWSIFGRIEIPEKEIKNIHKNLEKPDYTHY